MIVCIAEKPSVAAEIAHILKANRHVRVGRGNGYYEGNGYQVTWTYGHLCELKAPEAYFPHWRVWSLSALPIVPPRFGICLKKGMEEQFEVIERLFQKAERIINCGDAGQEGELIQRWVMQKAKVSCPVDRLWISSMTEEAIVEGFANLKTQSDYQNLYEAGLCRAIGDWLLGMNATRLYTLKYGSNARNAQPLSIGRVQTPTLALIVERQLEIQNFLPENYWVLSTNYRGVTFVAKIDNEEEEKQQESSSKEHTAKGGGQKRGFTDKKEAELALENIVGTDFTVTMVQKKKGTEAPPRLFDLTSLQVECNKKFGFGAEMTLGIVQELYETKLTTYPRVDTSCLLEAMHNKCAGILNGIAGQYAELLVPLRGKPLRKSQKVFDNTKITDHHAIIPTGIAPRALTDIQRKVYDLIARRFIAVFYPDSVFSTTTIEGEVGKIVFRTIGREILHEGWRAVFHATNEKLTTEAIKEMPHFCKGESGSHEPCLTEKETQPPKPYTEATLLRAMETAGRKVDNEDLRDALKENGIGRPSTRAAIIQTLYKRGYICQQRKNLEATPTGIELIGVIQEGLLKSAELTGQWEKKLRQIEQGNYGAAQFVEELKQMVQSVVQQVMQDRSNKRVTTSLSLETPNWSLRKKNDKLLNTETQNLPKEAKPKRIRKGSICPECRKGKVLKGKTAYGCSRWKEGCNWRKSFN